MNLLNWVEADDQDNEWLAAELFRRAALLYESLENWREAAECWTESGARDRAADLYCRVMDHTHAAPLFLAQGCYDKALESFRRWLDSVLEGDVIGQVTARLGIAACLFKLGAEPEAAKTAYRLARAMIANETHRHPITAGWCWEALGAYGALIGRHDLVLTGYEQALACYSEKHNDARMRAAKAYLLAVKDNRLLAEDLKIRLAEWGHGVQAETVRVKKDMTHYMSQAQKVTPTRALDDQHGYALGINFSPDSRCLASGGYDNSVYLWDPETGRQIHALKGHRGSVITVSFSPDGRYLASGGDDNSVRLWDLETGRQIHALEGHRGMVNSVSFSPDGRYLASGGNDNSVRLWDPETGRQIYALERHYCWVRSVSFSPDGRHLASGSNDKIVRLWDPETGQQIHALKGHNDWVRSVSFSPDGRYLASGGDDKIVRLWDLETGRQIHTLEGHDDWVKSVSFSPDGRYLASGSQDKTLLWNVIPLEISPLVKEA